MTNQRIWLVLILNFFIYVVRAGPYDWLLYFNDETDSYCFLNGYRHFCHLTQDNNVLVNETNRECDARDLWTFLMLKQNYTTTDTLIEWLIPFHLIEQYAEYLNSTDNRSSDNITICKCTRDRIGINCEYELTSRATGIRELIYNQRTSAGISYELLTSFVDEMTCNVDVIYVEWRQICDGIINCPDASDEFNCHLLELNKCNIDEFQCRNGMCIPIEFVFDVPFDCMDLSDEQEFKKIYTPFDRCLLESKYECDERLCRKDQFSCGDGLCVHWSALINHENGCPNARHAAYLCETIDSLNKNGQASVGICNQTTSQLSQLTNTSDCIVSFRYILNANQNKLANKTREIALNNIIDRCPELIEYPKQTIISPTLKIFYNKSLIILFYQNPKNFNLQISRKPHLYCLNGSLICSGIRTTLENVYCMSTDDFQKLVAYPYLPISELFCRMTAKQLSFQILVDDLDSQSFIYSCRNTSNRLALRRINDGHSDCLYNDDEKNSNYKMTEPYRFQCQTVSSPNQYVSFHQLGNGVNDCDDGSDEISREIRWSMFNCDGDDDGYACWVFQGNGIDEDRIKNVRLPYHRHCDSVWDTADGLDERNCSQWICADGTYQCNRTGQCIRKTYFCDGEFDCDDGEDELNCTPPVRQWNLEAKCNITNEHFCITLQYLEDPKPRRPCIPYTKAGDGHIDCIGGRDERNVFSCPDHMPLGDRFLCDNQTKCVNYTVLCNGIDDCLDRSDELICHWNRSRCAAGQFGCADLRACKNIRCNAVETCSDKSHWFWCPNQVTKVPYYRSGKYERLLNYEQSCYGQSTARPIINAPKISFVSSNTKAKRPFMRGFCNRGFYLHIKNSAQLACFCPPSFYGNRCQYDSRRVTLRVSLDRLHRFDIPQGITVLVLLIYNNSEIIDHQYFVDYGKDVPVKYNLYLLYPRPRSKGFYSVRLEAYHTIDFLAAWEYKITPFDFLPVFRLAKILRFPERNLPWRCLQNLCKNNGTCYIMNNGQHLCLCQRNWQGMYCERPLYDIKCAPHSLVRNRHICICPYGYLEPHCFVRNMICEKSHTCSKRNQICNAISHQPPDRYWCDCNASSCDERNALIIMHQQKPNQIPFLLQLMKLSFDYPRLKQQIIVHPSTNFPISKAIKKKYVRDAPELTPEIGLFFTFEPLVRSVNIILHLLFINCSKSVRNYTVNLDVQPQRCRSLQEVELHSVKHLQSFCLESVGDLCFLWNHYICYCNSIMIRQSECIPYQQRHIACTHCHNQGYCVQGDLLNKSDFVCVCPTCVSGQLCQFSPSRFSISLEFLIEKTQWGGYHFIGPVLFFVFGMIFNGLCVITFAQPKTRENGAGVYLLLNSLISQLVFIILFTRVVYLYISRQVIINQETNKILCKSLPYLMVSLHYISFWLMVFVTVERALVVVFPTRFSFCRLPKSAVVLSLLTAMFTFGSNYLHIQQYKLVSHPDNDLYPWCISEIEPSQQYPTQYVVLTHQIIPFLVNLIASLVIIIGISRSKANSHHLSTRDVLRKQVGQRLDLLLGPIICFITQLPQLIILFLDICDYNSETWFVHLILVAYYISFTPQINLFFLYLLPSSLYKEVLFTQTTVGKRLDEFFHYGSNKNKHPS